MRAADLFRLRSKIAAFTLVEILLVIVILGVLTAVSVPVYQSMAYRAEEAEALEALGVIRRAQLRYFAEKKAFSNARDTDEINRLFNVGIQDNFFSYKVVDATEADFKIIATRLGALYAEVVPALIAMTASGEITREWLPAGSLPMGTGGAPSYGGGSGGGFGSSSGGGSAGGGGLGSSGGSSGGSGSGGSSGGSTTVVFSGGGSAGTLPQALFGLSFGYIDRGPEAWSNWNDLNVYNTTSAEIQASLDLMEATPMLAQLAADLYAKGISVEFGSTEFDPGGSAATAYAYFSYSLSGQPLSPSSPPIIRLNPDLLSEPVELLTIVVLHEAVHFQQYLDGYLLETQAHGLSLFQQIFPEVDAEVRPFWNEAAYWETIRAGFGPPFDPGLEETQESLYQTALQGEAELRALLTSSFGYEG